MKIEMKQKRYYMMLVIILLTVGWQVTPDNLAPNGQTQKQVLASNLSLEDDASLSDPNVGLIDQVAYVPTDNQQQLALNESNQSHNLIAATLSHYGDGNRDNEPLGLSIAAPSLDASIVGSPDPVFPGGTIDYMITVTNTGDSPAIRVTLSDVLDSKVTFVSSNLPLVEQNGQTHEFVLGNMVPGSVVKMNIIVMAASNLTEGQTIVNNITIDADELPNTIKLSDTTTVTVPALNVFASPNPVMADELVTYTILYQNKSGGPISNLMITDKVSNVITSIENINAGSATIDDDQLPELVFSKPSVATGEVVQINVTGRTRATPWNSAPTPIVNQATATYSGQPQAENISITSFGHPNEPATIDLATNVPVASIAENLVITATVKDAYDNFVVDNTPLVVRGVFIENPPFVEHIGYTKNGLYTTFQRSTISQTASITFTAENGITALLEPVFAQPTLAITKLGNPQYVSSDGTLVYQIIMTNTGLVPVTEIQIDDQLDPNVTVVASSHSGSQNGNIYSVTVPKIAVGSQETVVLTTSIATGLANGTLIVNSVTVDALDIAAPLTSTTTSEIFNIFLDATASPAEVRAGGIVTYTIKHRNESGQNVDALQLTSNLPPQVNQILSINDGAATTVSDTPPALSFTRDNISDGEETTITIVGRVITSPWPAAPTTLSNRVVAIANMADGKVINRTAFAENAGISEIPDSLELDHADTGTIFQELPLTVIIKDKYGNPIVDGTTVTATGPAHMEIRGANTTTDGQAIVLLWATESGLSTVTVNVGGLSAQAVIDFTDIMLYIPFVTR